MLEVTLQVVVQRLPRAKRRTRAQHVRAEEVGEAADRAPKDRRHHFKFASIVTDEALERRTVGWFNGGQLPRHALNILRGVDDHGITVWLADEQPVHRVQALQFRVVTEAAPGGGEDLLQDVGHHEECGAAIKPVIAEFDPAGSSPHGGVRFVDRDCEAGGGEEHGRGQPPGAGADDGDRLAGSRPGMPGDRRGGRRSAARRVFLLPMGGENGAVRSAGDHSLYGFRPHRLLRFGKISLRSDAVGRIRADSTTEPNYELEMHQTPTLHATALERVSGLSARVAWAAAFERRLVARERDLVDAVHTDIGKPAWEVVSGEVMPLVASIRWHARHAPRALAPRKIGGAPWWMLGQTHWSYRLPVGRVLVIATWNYPVQLLGIQLVQSVMAGNRTVVKPSERAPRSQRLLVELAREALVDAGLPVDMVTSTEATRDAGRAILENEQFDHVVFTGSTAVGRQIAEACARTLTPSTLELSGRDSALVLADANVSLAAKSIWHAVTMNAGQTCMAPRRVLVERATYGAFIAAMRPLVAAARPVKLADAAMADRCVQLVQAAMLQGGRSLGGVVEPAQRGVMRPLCVADCERDAALVAGDHFGPVLAVLAVDGLDDAIAVHRAAGQHLATSVYTGRPDQLLADGSFIAALGSNVVTINDTVLPTAHPATAIEGRGASGWGASRGEAGLRALSREVTCSTTSGRVRTPLDEPSASAKGWLRRLAFGGRPEAAVKGTAGAGVPSVANQSEHGVTHS